MKESVSLTSFITTSLKYIISIIKFILELFILYKKTFELEKFINNIKKHIDENFDSISFQIDNIKSNLKRSGVVFFKKIDNKSEALNGLLDPFNKIEINEDGSSSMIELENTSFSEKRITCGTYEFSVDNLIKDKNYLITFKPEVSDYFYPFETNDDLIFDGSAGTEPDSVHINKNNDSYTNTQVNKFFRDEDLNNYVKTNVPPSENLTINTSPPYESFKKTSLISISIKGSDDDNFINCINAIGDYAQISSVQGGQFYYSPIKTYEYLVIPEGNPDETLQYITIYGGKGYQALPSYFIFNSGNNSSVKLKINFSNIDEVSNMPKFEDVNTCLSELLITIETYYQDRPINNIPKDIENINNPELDYGDGGERYYEPWKFWFEGELGSDKNGGASWYKKWKSWFKKKVKNHNDRLDGNGTEDIDAWMEDNKHKGDHL